MIDPKLAEFDAIVDALAPAEPVPSDARREAAPA